MTNALTISVVSLAKVRKGRDRLVVCRPFEPRWL